MSWHKFRRSEGLAESLARTQTDRKLRSFGAYPKYQQGTSAEAGGPPSAEDMPKESLYMSWHKYRRSEGLAESLARTQTDRKLWSFGAYPKYQQGTSAEVGGPPSADGTPKAWPYMFQHKFRRSEHLAGPLAWTQTSKRVRSFRPYSRHQLKISAEAIGPSSALREYPLPRITPKQVRITQAASAAVGTQKRLRTIARLDLMRSDLIRAMEI